MKSSFLTKFIYDLGILGLGLLIIHVFTGTGEIETNDYTRDFQAHYGIYALDIPEGLEFAGEKVPLNKDDVRERLDRELLVNTYWQSNTLLFFKRANRWFPVIEPILKKHGIPDDFKYLTLVESGLLHVISPSGATGYWQFMKNTAKEYGLEITDEVDQRYDIYLSTEAACRFFKNAYEELGDWTLAAASYNIGISGLRWHLEQQDVTSFYDLYLNTETSRYVFRAIAIKEILTHPEKYGFHFETRHLYQPYSVKEIVVDSTIDNLTHFAQSHGITYKELKILNPWLRSHRLTVKSGKKYVIRLPLKSSGQPINIFTYSANEPKTSSKKVKEEKIIYTVKPKDNLHKIARYFDVSVEDLVKWNKLTDTKLLKGQQLIIYK